LTLIVFSSVRKPLAEGGLTLLAIFYAGFPIATWMPIRELTDAQRFSGLGTVGVLFAATWLCDSGAYFVGRFFGKHRLYPEASPNKTVEGAIGGLVFATLLLPSLFYFDLAAPKLQDYLALPVIVGIFGQLGDLLESLMKREMQVKDTSQLIPGHGGFLDRFDSLLISSPLFLAYLLLVRA
jgi:phosphatidate cytidylyltransferase